MAFLGWAPLAPAQDKGKEPELPPAVDPYTAADPAAMQKAGYVAFGNFSFGGKAGGTATIQNTVGGMPILWVETAHFKIGSTLPECRTPSDPERKKVVVEELRRLRERIPTVNDKTKKLDPWLRLHLYALRLEDLYAEFQRLAGVTDASFPKQRGELIDGKFVGDGPYLGMEDKFGVLLFEKTGTVGRYFQSYAGRSTNTSMRWCFDEPRCLVYGTAQELFKDEKDVDTALCADVTYGMVQSFVEGFQAYSHVPPPWLNVGLARWFARRVDPQHLRLLGVQGYNANDDDQWKFEERLYGRAKSDFFPPAERAVQMTDMAAMDFTDHMMAWSRVDFLLSLGEAQFGRFLDGVKGQLQYGQDQAKYVQDLQLAALKDVYGFDLAAFDAGWKAYVLKNYK